MSTSIHSLISLGYDLDANGFAGREGAVRQLVREARVAGCTGAAVAVLADPEAPEVARLRAFAAVASDLAPHREHGRELIGAA
jgi:hypothetical protein